MFVRLFGKETNADKFAAALEKISIKNISELKNNLSIMKDCASDQVIESELLRKNNMDIATMDVVNGVKPSVKNVTDVEIQQHYKIQNNLHYLIELNRILVDNYNLKAIEQFLIDILQHFKSFNNLFFANKQITRAYFLQNNHVGLVDNLIEYIDTDPVHTLECAILLLSNDQFIQVAASRQFIQKVIPKLKNVTVDVLNNISIYLEFTGALHDRNKVIKMVDFTHLEEQNIVDILRNVNDTRVKLSIVEIFIFDLERFDLIIPFIECEPDIFTRFYLNKPYQYCTYETYQLIFTDSDVQQKASLPNNTLIDLLIRNNIKEVKIFEFILKHNSGLFYCYLSRILRFMPEKKGKITEMVFNHLGI